MKGKTILRLAVFLALVAILVILVVTTDLPQLLRQFLEFVDGMGLIGPLIFIAVYIIVTVLFVPGSILTLGSGAVFGVVFGTIYVSIAATIGALAAFLVGRFLLRNWVKDRLTTSKNFKEIDSAIGREGGKIIFLLRLSPLFPFNASNYIYSVTAVKTGAYILATWLGTLPGTILYVYIGSLIGTGIQVASEAVANEPVMRDRMPLEWVFYGVGLVATIVASIYVARVARRAIKKRID